MYNGDTRVTAGADVDVAIIGGGLVGATLGVTLASHGFSVLIIEATEPVLGADGPPRDELGVGARFDRRVVALNHASRNLLETTSVWGHLRAARITPFAAMVVWEDETSEVTFSAPALGEIDLGCIVENRELLRALEARSARLSALSWQRPAALTDLVVGAEGVVVHTSAGVSNARLVIGADGARSRVRELIGIDTAIQGYEQHAIVTNIKTQRSHRDTAWQRFLPTGPLAVLPLPDGYSSIVWSAEDDEAQRLMALDAERFRRELASALDNRLGHIEWADERVTFPLARLRVSRYVDARVALVGDAAHTIHPLAGQGVNLGLLDAACLAEVLVDGARSARDPGSARALRRYERWRSGHNRLMQDAIHAFDWAFRHPAPGVSRARRSALAGANRLRGLKHFFIRQALGQPHPVGWSLPRLAAGRRL
ncbi:MAG: UbiH/UbiF/VisC/COQ6 family ubiquinone biosynthesis hydroxylase [Pseudomonadota bacterium]